MRVLADVHVPDDVVEVFRARGHEVVHAREAFAPGTPDEVLAQWCHEHDHVLLSWDRHFRKFRRDPQGERDRFFRLSRLSFQQVPPGRARQRTEQVMALIEAEHGIVQTMTDKRIIVSVTMQHISFSR